MKQGKKSAPQDRNAGKIFPNHPEMHSGVPALLLSCQELVCAFSLLFLGGIATSANRAIRQVFKKEVTSKEES